MAQKRNKGGKLQLGGGGQTKALMIIVNIIIKSLLQAGNQGGNTQLEGGGQGENSNFIFSVSTEVAWEGTRGTALQLEVGVPQENTGS